MIGWVFPGQGSQHVGMASALTSDAARSTFTEASDLLGWDVAKACDEGPAERLDATEVTQPAMLTVDVAAARTLHALGLSPDVVAGHSVGEFAALVTAGVLSFEDALRAVNVRADAMRRAGRAHPGAPPSALSNG